MPRRQPNDVNSTFRNQGGGNSDFLKNLEFQLHQQWNANRTSRERRKARRDIEFNR